jgi:hypothetical protein
MLNFCTLFDINYLSRGLTMYDSLLQQGTRFHLFVFAFDNQVLDILRNLKLAHITVISLAEFEDPELLAIKPTRGRGEYCWTCTPSTILYILHQFSVDHCTYIDADLYFYSDPSILLDEMEDKSVLITAHRFSPEYADAAINGKYCVQFMTFKNTEAGLKVLQWWRNACLDWCYNRLEDGKFGDQKYLDDWTSRFENVHELKHLGGGVAPWNVQQYRLSVQKGKLYGREEVTGNVFPLVFYHFHGLRFLIHDKVDLGEYNLPKPVEQLIYRPYLRHLDTWAIQLQQKYISIRPYEEAIVPQTLSYKLKNIRRKVEGHYNIYNKIDFLN